MQAKAEWARIFRFDESELRSDASGGSVISAVDNRGKLFFMVSREKLTTKVLPRFLNCSRGKISHVARLARPDR